MEKNDFILLNTWRLVQNQTKTQQTNKQKKQTNLYFVFFFYLQTEVLQTTSYKTKVKKLNTWKYVTKKPQTPGTKPYSYLLIARKFPNSFYDKINYFYPNFCKCL